MISTLTIVQSSSAIPMPVPCRYRADRSFRQVFLRSVRPAQGVRMFTFDSIPRMRSKVDAAEIKNGNAFKVQPGTHARAIQQFYDIMLLHIAGILDSH
jgi:hypothetical protein